MSDGPKTRFEIVSKGVGALSGGIMCLFVGLILFFFSPQYAYTIWAMALFMLGMGILDIFGGVNMRTKTFKCPTCKADNEVLRDVTSFPCKECGKPIYLRRAKRPGT